MDKRLLGIVAIVIVTVLAGASLFQSRAPTPTAKELDFTVTASSDCLRFLNSSVPTIYVPFTTAENQNWQLTVNSTKMPGGVNGYTDVYIYKGYWDKGSNYTCVSSDLYPILGDIQSLDRRISLNHPFTETYNGTNPQSYTLFFVVPPGGQPATFHVTYKQVN